DREWAQALDLLAGGRGQAFVESARSLLSSGDYGLALRLIDLGLTVHPSDNTLPALRQRALSGLRARYQNLDPFRFIWYSHEQAAELPPVDGNPVGEPALGLNR
ncbi:MAG: hypothetical protein J2P28_17940, partial [Actinobacteria bacterium]|nr:hypothetical protein [Actinomycetota bacterium]